MAHVSVSGVVAFGDGAAYLRLVPDNTPQPPSSTPSAANARNVPWPSSTSRLDEQIHKAIKEGKVEVHSSRQPLTKKRLQVALNNIQRALDLKVGVTGAWNQEADFKLLRLLASAKKTYSHGNNTPKAIEDAPDELAIEDEKMDDDVAIGTSPTAAATSSVDDPGLAVVSSDNMVLENKGEENEGDVRTPSKDMDVDDSSDSSSSSSSSSSSTHKSTLRRRIAELQGMLEETTEDLVAANTALGLNV